VRITRPLRLNDAAALSDVLSANRAFLAPWQPLRPDTYYGVDGQREAIAKALKQHDADVAVPLVIEDHSGALVGTITLQSIIRGAFQSCSVGYWLSEDAQGQGLATAALAEAASIAFGPLRLHRIQAETLRENVRSQRVLTRAGFVEYGVAESYMHIGGRWQDNVLYQLLTPTPDRVITG
jgi:ribosomal-protein-alanine N-acetyltransferase